MCIWHVLRAAINPHLVPFRDLNKEEKKDLRKKSQKFLVKMSTFTDFSLYSDFFILKFSGTSHTFPTIFPRQIASFKSDQKLNSQKKKNPRSIYSTIFFHPSTFTSISSNLRFRFRIVYFPLHFHFHQL